MSAGHPHGHPAAALIGEVQRLLQRADVRAYLARSYRVRIVPVPLTGGSSTDGREYFLDPNIATADRPLVLLHERIEKALRTVLGLHYLRAHALTTAAEYLDARRRGVDWAAYKRRIDQTVRQDEQERPRRLPQGFDVVPYRESGMMKLLRRAA